MNSGNGERRKGNAIRAVACLLLAVTLLTAAGCGRPSLERSEEERVAEGVLKAVMERDGKTFLEMVAPSFLEQAKSEMPEADEETLGGVLLAGYSQKIPYREAENLVFQIQEEGDRAAVHVWGDFRDWAGEKVTLTEGQALRIPLRREEGRWYLDLLDI